MGDFDSLSRREFLKKSIGVGAGLGSLALMPRAAFSQDDPDSITLNILAMRMGSTEYIADRSEEWVQRYKRKTGVDVTVNWEFLEEKSLRSQAVQDMATGTGYYQVSQLGTQHVPLMASNDWIVPLDDHFPSDYGADEFVEAVVTGASYQGAQYGVPIYHEATHLIYRHDIFDEMGMEPPSTLGEMREKAKKIDRDRDIAGVVLRGKRGAGLNHVSWKQYLHAFDGDWLRGMNKPYRAAFNSREGRKATEWYADLIRNHAPTGSQTAHWRDVMSLFMAGQAAMTIDATSIGRRIVTDDASQVIGKTSFETFPEGPAGRYPWFFSWNLGVSKVGTQGATREAAIDYVLWAASREMKMDMMSELGTLPARTSTLESQAAKDYYGKPGLSNWLPNTLKSLDIQEASANPVIAKIPEWPSVGDTIGLHLEQIFTGSTSVDGGLEAAAEAINNKSW